MQNSSNKVGPSIKPARFDVPRILRWILVFIIYLIIFSALDSLTGIFQSSPGVVTWYPPDGFSLAFLLSFGAGFTPVFTFASLVSSLIIYRFSTPLGSNLIWAVVLSSAYGIESILLRRRVRIDPQLKALRDTLWLLLTSAIVSTLLAVISVSALVYYGKVAPAQYFNAFMEWWIGEMIGVVVFTPFLLIHVMPWVKRFIAGEWANFKQPKVFHRPSIQSIAQVVSIPVILYAVFGIPALRSFEPYYLMAVPLIWIALKNGFSKVSLAIIGMNFGTILAIWLFKFDHSNLSELQFLMFGIYASTLLTGAIVTRQKRIEEVLRQSEVRNRALIENAPDAIVLWGADGLSKYMSPSAERILGYAPEEVIGHDTGELTHPNDLPAQLKIIGDLRQTPGKVVTTQYRLRHKDGSWRWLEGTLTNLLAEPSIQAIVFNFRDITERKQAEETLQNSEKRFRALVEHSLEEISLIDSNGTLTYESPTELRPLGYPPNSFVGHNLFDLFPPDERAAAASLLEEVVKHPGSSQEALFRLRHQDGSWRWMEGVMTNLLDEPAVQSVVINYRDITERKRAEQEIASMAKFPSENPNPVMRLGRDGSLMYANTASAALLQMWGSGVGEPAPQFWRELVSQGLASMENITVDVECAGKVYSMFVAPVAEADYVDVYGRDVTESKLAEAERNQSEALFRALFELSPDSIVLIDPHDPKVSWPIIDCNKAACLINGYSRDELIGQSIDILNAAPGTQAERIAYRKQLREAGNLNYEVLHCHKDGSVFPVDVSTTVFTVGGRELVLGIDREISERKRAEEALRQSEEKYRDMVNTVNDGIFVTNDRGVLTFANQALARIHGFERPEELVGRTFIEFVAPAMVGNITQLFRESIQSGTTSETIEFEIIRPNGTSAFIEIKPVSMVEDGKVIGIRGVVRDVTARKQAEQDIKISNDELSMLFELSHSLAEADSLENILELVNRHAVESIHTTFARIALLEDEKFSIRAGYPIRFLEHNLGIGERNPLADLPYSKRVLEQTEPAILRASDPGIRDEEKKALLLDFAQSVCLVPLRISDSYSTTVQFMGFLMLGEVRSENREPFTPGKLRLAQTIGDSAAIAIRRMLLREQTERRLQQLTALSTIDRAISSTFDLQISLGVLLQQVSMLLGVDATDVLLFNPNSLTLEYSAGRGFRTKAFEHAQLRLGEGYAGQAAVTRETVHIPDLAAQQNNLRLEKYLADEQFVSYYGVPLISRGQIMGVLEIFQRAALETNEEWLVFLSTLAGQAAIAIDSVMQFEHVQRSNIELSQAYDETIEGWSHALDLRDKETEGHTQRVTELTVKLARYFGLSEQELVHVRRGALLHDIGKMGVPDGILIKPGPLTDEEWVIMRKHPTFAYEMLSPIHYLRAAIDIPYCHHEKWDGSGYPRGLRGEQIPLAARIFAVVDVWDALSSDRVYRAAWPKEKVLEHIRSLAGTHFDPQVTKVCLESGLLEG
jgi:PAS domain S-box-containing protein/putative nucleotidyltransferase with HDIG domain